MTCEARRMSLRAPAESSRTRAGCWLFLGDKSVPEIIGNVGGSPERIPKNMVDFNLLEPRELKR